MSSLPRIAALDLRPTPARTEEWDWPAPPPITVPSILWWRQRAILASVVAGLDGSTDRRGWWTDGRLRLLAPPPY